MPRTSRNHWYEPQSKLWTPISDLEDRGIRPLPSKADTQHPCSSSRQSPAGRRRIHGKNLQKELKDFFRSHPSRPLIVVLGPTASGKTKFSLQLAHHLKDVYGVGAEIVNADSRQIYRELDIGTAKISTEEMQGIPHHLLSVLDPRTECTIAWFQREALRIIDEIHSRGNVPFLVGGSMLYLSSVIDGYHPLPPADARVRRRLSRAYDRDGGRQLHERLSRVDPESAVSIPRQNKVYLIRALEIYEQTGRPKSKQLKRSGCPFDLLIFGLRVEKEELKRRIRCRTEQMLRAGWIVEVRSLLEKGYTMHDPAMISTGYREIIHHLKDSLEPMKALNKIVVQTCQYAKRQMTWWKRDARIKWISSSDLDSPDQR